MENHVFVLPVYNPLVLPEREVAAQCAKHTLHSAKHENSKGGSEGMSPGYSDV